MEMVFTAGKHKEKTRHKERDFWKPVNSYSLFSNHFTDLSVSVSSDMEFPEAENYQF